jgi:hypothetical protein
LWHAVAGPSGKNVEGPKTVPKGSEIYFVTFVTFCSNFLVCFCWEVKDEAEFTFVTFCSNVLADDIANQQGLGLLNIQVVRGADFSVRVIYSDQVAGSILLHANGDVTRGKRK